MEVYELPQTAEESLKEQVSDLFMKQISMRSGQETKNLVLNGIEKVLADGSPSHIIIAEEQGELMGMALVNIGISLRTGGKYIWLNELFVDQSQRNQGIGRKLLLYIIYWAEQEHIQTIELETGISNSVTKHLYNSLGFYDVVSKRYGFSF